MESVMTNEVMAGENPALFKNFCWGASETYNSDVAAQKWSVSA